MDDWGPEEPIADQRGDLLEIIEDEISTGHCYATAEQPVTDEDVAPSPIGLFAKKALDFFRQVAEMICVSEKSNLDF